LKKKRKDGSYVLDFPATVISNINFQKFLDNSQSFFFAVHDNTSPDLPYAVNGGKPTSYSITGDRWTRLRMAFAVLLGYSSSVTIPSPCEARLLAIDGMWISSVPGPATTTFGVSGAGRLDIAVKCPSNIPGGKTQITWASTGKLVLDFVVTPGSGTETPFDSTGRSWSPRRPYHMETTIGTTPTRIFDIKGDVDGVWWDGTSKSINKPSTTPAAHLQYDKIYQLNIRHDLTTPKWDAGHRHPIHLHVYPMQIIGPIDILTGVVTPGDCASYTDHLPSGTLLPSYKQGEWYDTIFTTDFCAVRFRTRGFNGAVMLHCHMLIHEDGGAMILIRVDEKNSITGDAGPDSANLINPPVVPITCPAII
jgi:FtsP/CotA-like multicopper oxidase with cupredoxin domain